MSRMLASCGEIIKFISIQPVRPSLQVVRLSAIDGSRTGERSRGFVPADFSLRFYLAGFLCGIGAA